MNLRKKENMIFNPNIDYILANYTPDQARDVFLDELAEYEYFWSKQEKKRRNVTPIQAYVIFKKEIPIVLKVKEKFEEKEMYRYDYLKKPMCRKECELDIERARNVPLSSVLDGLGIQHNRGRANSPFGEGNNETTLSFKDNFFYCFRTGKKGDTIKFVMELTGKDFKEAVQYLLMF